MIQIPLTKESVLSVTLSERILKYRVNKNYRARACVYECVCTCDARHLGYKNAIKYASERCNCSTYMCKMRERSSYRYIQKILDVSDL